MKLPGGGMGWTEFFKALMKEMERDNVSDAAGAVTYAGILALFPFLLFLVSLASVIITPDQADAIVKQLAQVAPKDVTTIVGDRIRAISSEQKTGLLTFGAIAALWAASSGVMALMRALNTIYGVKEGRPFWKTRGIGLGMTLLTSAIALGAALVAIASPAVGEYIGGPLGTAIVWLRLPVAGVLMMFLWAVLYYVLPDVEQKFKFITPGSVMGVVLWLVASWGFSFYVSHFGSYEATYGSLGGIIVTLLWMWISCLVLLVGAESNAVIEHKSEEGKRAGAKLLADSGASGTKTEAEEPTEPFGSFGQGVAAGRAEATARARAFAGLAALVGGAMWLKKREDS